MTSLLVLPRACSTCPYRRDTPPGIWSVEEYEKLREIEEGTLIPTPPGARGEWRMPALVIFHCHQSNATDEEIACRGWLSVHRYSAGVRLAQMIGALRAEDIPTEDESEVYYSSGTEACEAGLVGIADPSSKARKAVTKLLRKGAGR